jgi:hypothetical protein
MRFTVISSASRPVRGVALVLSGDWFYKGRYEPAPRWGVTRRRARGGIFRGRPRGTTVRPAGPGARQCRGGSGCGCRVWKLAGPPAVVVVLATVDAGQ